MTTKSIKIELSMDLVHHILKKTKHKSLDNYVNTKLKEDLLKPWLAVIIEVLHR